MQTNNNIPSHDDIMGNVVKFLFGSNKVSYSNKQQVATPQDSVTYNGFKINKDDFDKIRPVLFGEVSNRPYDKKQLEANVIMSTILNRQNEYKKVHKKDYSLNDIVSMPNQYQAYGGKQYNLYNDGTTTDLDTQKKNEIDSISDDIWNQLKSGSFKDQAGGGYYYKHNEKDGSITYDNERQLFTK